MVDRVFAVVDELLDDVDLPTVARVDQGRPVVLESVLARRPWEPTTQRREAGDQVYGMRRSPAAKPKQTPKRAREATHTVGVSSTPMHGCTGTRTDACPHASQSTTGQYLLLEAQQPARRAAPCHTNTLPRKVVVDSGWAGSAPDTIRLVHLVPHLQQRQWPPAKTG